MGLLSGVFKGRKNEDEIEHIAVILFRQNEGIGYVCKINHTQQGVDIIDERAFKYSNSWENLVYDVDELLFNFENIHSIKLSKATFFVYSHLVDPVTGELKEPYVHSLKTVISENKLESLGYIELEESLAQTYTQIEQTPLNAVLVEVDAASVSVFVYKGGQKNFSNTIAKTENLLSDIEELFKRTEKGLLLPARILMYDSPTVESESHIILTHTWPKNLFIQLPRVDVVRDFELKQAIVFGVTQETFGMNSVKAMPSSVAPLPVAADTMSIDDPEDAPKKPEAPLDSSKEDKATPPAASVVAPNTMGFVVGGDVREQEDDVMYTNEQFTPAEASVVENPDPTAPPPMSYAPEKPNPIQGIIEAAKLKLMNIRTLLTAGNSKQRTMTAILLISGLVLVVGSLFVTLFFFHKAKLIVLYKSEPIEDTLTFSNEKQFKKFSETFTASAKVSTTGSQDIGEKASGDITIYNADESAKTFEKGTTIETADGQVFLLDEDVTVDAAESTITDEGDVLTSTSKAPTSATAKDIGPTYNIKKDTKLTFDGLSSTTYFARANSAFTGGTSKEVQTVAKADYTKIDSMIQAELAKKSKAQLQKISTQGNIIEDLTLVDDKNQTYSKEISEEATSLTSKVTAKVSFYAYDDQALKALIAEEFKGDIPDGYVLDMNDITYKIASADRDEKTTKISIDVDAVAKPKLKVDTQRLIEEVKGSSLASIRPQLQDGFNASGYEAVIDSPLPLLRSRLPWFSQNITVELKPSTQ